MLPRAKRCPQGIGSCPPLPQSWPRLTKPYKGMGPAVPTRPGLPAHAPVPLDAAQRSPLPQFFLNMSPLDGKGFDGPGHSYKLSGIPPNPRSERGVRRTAKLPPHIVVEAVFVFYTRTLGRVPCATRSTGKPFSPTACMPGNPGSPHALCLIAKRHPATGLPPAFQASGADAQGKAIPKQRPCPTPSKVRREQC